MRIKRRTRISLRIDEALLIQNQPGDQAPIQGPLAAALSECLKPLLDRLHLDRLHKDNATPGSLLSKTQKRKEQPS